jgi:(E)-4-hydroxy-3-methylbut-2-enyl-diphosphate synthase
VGIGTLLFEGIGDTIRVSLSEDPEAEIPVAKALVDYVTAYGTDVSTSLDMTAMAGIAFDSQRPVERNRDIPMVIADYSQVETCTESPDLIPDFLYLGKNTTFPKPENRKIITDYEVFSFGENEFPLFTVKDKEAWLNSEWALPFLRLNCSKLNEDWINHLIQKPQTILILSSDTANVFEQKAFVYKLMQEGIENPIILQRNYKEKDLELFQIKSATDCGVFFLDRLVAGIFLQNETDAISPADINACSFGILQATGRRISKTEYISCPSCGRTLFDLQTTLKKIKSATAHLKGLKIGVMGCIVNGPGEMADADYGYVGAGVGRVSLYKGKECVKKNIPEAGAVEELLRLIAADSFLP